MADVFVTTLSSDLIDGNDGEVTLREAVQIAGQGDRILFQAGLTGTLTLTQGQITLDKDVTISGDTNGDQRADVTISGGGASRVFDIVGGADFANRTDVTLRELTLTQGLADVGGAVRSADQYAELTLVNSTVSDSVATAGLYDGGGGGVFARDFIATNVTFSGNQAAAAGGALYLASGSNDTDFLTNVTFYGNFSGSKGGALYLNAANAYIYNGTISDNVGGQNGGGMTMTNGAYALVLNTVVNNNLNYVGDVVDVFDWTNDSELLIRNSFVSTTLYFSNIGTLNLDGTVLNAGGDAGLGPLQDNGGPIPTMSPGAVLVDAGQNNVGRDRGDADGDGSGVDPLEFDANGNARILRLPDIGAVERVPTTFVVDDFSDGVDGDLSAGNLTFREAVEAAFDGDTITFAEGGTVTLTSQIQISDKALTLDGDLDADGRFDVTLQQTSEFARVLDISGPGDTVVTMTGLRLTGGRSSSDGGGLKVGQGAEVTLVNSQIDGNTSAAQGGGVSVDPSSAFTVFNSAVFNNTATGREGYDYGEGAVNGPVNALGGGIYNQGTLALYNSTIAANTIAPDVGRYDPAFARPVDAKGGGIYSAGQVTLVHSTVTDNAIFAGGVNAEGGGIATSSPVTLRNAIVSGNFSQGAPSDVAGTIQGTGNAVGGDPADIFLETTARGGGALSLVAGAPSEVARIKAGGPADGIGETNVLPADSLDLDGDGNRTERIDVDATLQDRAQFGVADAGAVEAQPFVVTTEQDVVDANDGETSLREAIASRAGVINFDDSLAGATLVLTQGALVIDAAVGDLQVNGDIDGDGKADVTLSGDRSGDGVAGPGDTRIFEIAPAGMLALQSLDLTHGYSGLAGGAAYVQGTLQMRNVTVRDSFAEYSGGGLFLAYGSTLQGTNVTFTGNRAIDYGGGLYAYAALDVTLSNATFTQNEANAAGGGISQNGGTLTLYHATVSDNVSGDAGGLENFGGTATLINSVVAGNTSTNGDRPDILVNGTMTMQGSVVTSDVQAQGIIDNGNNLFTDADPGLLPLADTGGPVPTMALATGSPLRDSGVAAALPADTLDIDGDSNTSEDLPLAANGAPRNFGVTPAARPDIGAHEIAIDLDHLVVDTLVDENDGSFDPGDLSLREAVAFANPGATISFADGLAGRLVLTQGHIVLNKDVRIHGDTDGDLEADLILDGNDASRIFRVSNAADARLTSLTLTNGREAVGGAVLVDGSAALTIVNSTLSGNTAGDGGAILTSGETTIINSTLSGNRATTSLYDMARGGAIFSALDSDLALINATVFGNQATVESQANYLYAAGGGIYARGDTLSISHSTITNNHVGTSSTYGSFAGGGGVADRAEVETITNSIISGNSGGSDLRFNLGAAGQGANIIGSDIYLGATAAGQVDLNNLFVVAGGSPNLSDQGGPVKTVLMRFGGVHMNLGDPDFIPTEGQDTDGDGAPDLPSPVDAGLNDRAVSGRPDVGATEFQVAAIVGTNEDDAAVNGTSDHDSLMGLFGNDSLAGRNGQDTLDGGFGNDTLSGGNDADLLFGVFGDDVLIGGKGRDSLFGNDGADQLEGQRSNDLLDGGAGDDVLIGGKGRDSLFGNDGADQLDGQRSDDLLDGGAGDDVLRGGGGNDTLLGGSGKDVLNGAGRADLLDGGAENDELIGGVFSDTLIGGSGDDRLIAGRDPDRLEGGTGNDFLKGGADGDVFVFDLGFELDRISDFNLSEDRLEISGALAAGRSEAQVAALAQGAGTGFEMDFGNGDVLRFPNLTSVIGLESQIDIV